jgi:YD repeat-containing protein
VFSQVDALGNLTQYFWHPLDRLTQITDANNGLTKFAYDAVGNLKSLTDAKSNQTSYGYDSRNRVTSRIDALTKVDSYGYDATGNRTSYTDRNGNVINYTYDPLNRVSQVQYNIASGGHHTTLQSSGCAARQLDDRGFRGCVGHRGVTRAESRAGTDIDDAAATH